MEEGVRVGMECRWMTTACKVGEWKRCQGCGTGRASKIAGEGSQVHFWQGSILSGMSMCKVHYMRPCHSLDAA